ncbi:hypothetical protein [Roseovarius pacificus]|uniref:hypothetical protein n=1 Tax=Roseovarius pacificus TaxID=337701 RepID=UPI002A188D30|nr:hypothetical protein [Roseovarius pacificus]
MGKLALCLAILILAKEVRADDVESSLAGVFENNHSSLYFAFSSGTFEIDLGDTYRVGALDSGPSRIDAPCVGPVDGNGEIDEAARKKLYRARRDYSCTMSYYFNRGKRPDSIRISEVWKPFDGDDECKVVSRAEGRAQEGQYKGIPVWRLVSFRRKGLCPRETYGCRNAPICLGSYTQAEDMFIGSASSDFFAASIDFKLSFHLLISDDEGGRVYGFK